MENNGINKDIVIGYKMDKIIVKKIKCRELSETLRGMKVGQEVFFGEKEFRPMSVYNACYRLQREGLTFNCSAKKSIDGCKVTRIK